MLTQAELAAKSDMPQPVLSKIEMGSRIATPEQVRRFADVLGVPVAFLFRNPVELPEGSLGLFRALKSKVPSKEFTKARRLAELAYETIVRLADGRRLPPMRLESLKGIAPEDAAQYARTILRLPPDAPIANLTRSLEASGVLVVRLSDIDENITGFASWVPAPDGERPMIVARRRLSAFRLRWTIAHEFGHLAFRHQVFAGPQRPEEKEANAFAAALLLPMEPFLDDVGGEKIDLRKLAELKGKWGVSMQAALLRAKGLGCVDEQGYLSMYQTMRVKGYLRKEPGDDTTAQERPRLLDDLAAAAGIEATAETIAGRLDLGMSHARAIVGDRGDRAYNLAALAP